MTKKTLIYLLKCFVSFTLGLGLFNFVGSRGLISVSNGFYFYGPALALIISMFVIVFKVFIGKRKFEIPVLVALLWAGIVAVEFFGGQASFIHMEKFKLSSISNSYIEKHNQLNDMNYCEVDSDCLLLLGSENTNCYYLINSKSVDKAIAILKTTGESVQECRDLNTISGVMCHKKTCFFGDGRMMEAKKW